MRNWFQLLFLLALLLVVRLFFHYQDSINYKIGDTFKKTHSFNHEPKKNSYGQYFYIGKIFVSIPLYPKYYYGDKINIDGIVSEIQTDKGSIIAVEKPTITKVEEKSFPISLSRYIRQKVESTTASVIPSRESGLLLGIILGVRDKIDRDFYESLKAVGVLHVIAASGQNVSILASLLLLSFQRLVKRNYAILFTVLGIMFYSFLTGFDPPIVRASIMALISYGALIFGRQNTGIYALLLTGWGMVFYQPEMVEDISFQLSFLSTLGIIVIKPLIDCVINLRLIKLIKDDLSTTLSAQIATLPLMLWAFGSYSLLSLPVNLLILWTVPFIMVFGGLGFLLSLVSPLASKPLILLSFPFTAYFAAIVEYFDQFQLNITVDKFPITLITGYYLILLALLIKFKNFKRRKI